MSSLELRKLNLYPELKTVAGIQSVVTYLTPPNNVVPVGLNQRQRARFIQKFGNGDWRIDAHNTLFYNPPTNNHVGQGRINLEVIPPILAVKNNKLNAIFDENREGLGLGLNQFYYQVSKQCLGITRRETSDFLKRQGNYQVSRPVRKTLNHPILSRCPNYLWQVDCINLNPYNHILGNRLFIMTVVDVFSKKVFARAITNEQAVTATNALQNIMNTNNTAPHIVQTDGGGAFQGAFHAFLVAHNIRHMVSRSHTPTSNAVVERMNMELRKKIRANIVKTNALRWTAFLNQFCDNINNQKNSSTGFTPNELWEQGYNPPVAPLNAHVAINDRSSYADIREKVMANQLHKATTALLNQRIHTFYVGDQVRIKLEVIQPAMRQRNKDKQDVKYNAVTFTPQVFVVYHVVNANIPVHPLPPNANLVDVKNEKYNLRSLGGVIIRENNNPASPPKQFFSSDLVLVPPNSTPSNVPDFARARILNRL